MDGRCASFKIPPRGDSLQGGTRVIAGGSEKVPAIYLRLTDGPTHPRRSMEAVTARCRPWSVFDVLTGKWRGAGRLARICIGLVEVRHVDVKWDIEVRLAARLLFLRAIFRPTSLVRLLSQLAFDSRCQLLISRQENARTAPLPQFLRGLRRRVGTSFIGATVEHDSKRAKRVTNVREPCASKSMTV